VKNMAKRKTVSKANPISSTIGLGILGMLFLGFAAYRIAGVSQADNVAPVPLPHDNTQQAVTDPVTGVSLSGVGLVMISRDGCSWCDKFTKEEAPKFESVGYQFESTKAIKTDKYPKFRIWDGKAWTDRVGFFTLEDFKNGDAKSPELPPDRTEAEPVPNIAPVPQTPRDAKPGPTVAPAVVRKVSPAKVRAVDPVSGFVVTGPTVIILSTDGCAPCLTWDRTAGSVLRLKDIEVFAIKTVQKPSYPAFRIFDGKNWHDRAGSRTTAEEILSLIAFP